MTDVVVTVSGQSVACMNFEITGGSYGSVGHGIIETTRAFLTNANIDLFTLAAEATAPIEVNVTVDGTKLFGGELIDTDWKYDRDIVALHVRDWAGVLLDQKRIMTDMIPAITTVSAPFAPGQLDQLNIPTQNATLQQIITAIANTFGLKPVFNFTTFSGQTSNPRFGAESGTGESAFTSAPQSLWAILNQLAREVGYEIYVTPNKELVFGEPGAGLETIALSYQLPLQSNVRPCRDLRIQHNPRRNSTFRVLVLSYDNVTAQSVIGRTTVIGTGFYGVNSDLKAKGVQQANTATGIYNGQDAIQADAALLGKAETTPIAQVQLYTFHIDGLTASQAQARAYAIAYDIMKREIAFSAEIDGYAAMLPTQRFTLTGNVDKTIVNRTYYTHSYTHHFDMPRPGSRGSDSGFVTRFRGLTYPPGGVS